PRLPLDWFDGGVDTRGAEDLCGALRVGAGARGTDDLCGALRVGAGARGAADRLGAVARGAVLLLGAEAPRLAGLVDGERCCTGAEARGRDVVARGVCDALLFVVAAPFD
ncbi:MAG: hypothetical protein ACKVJN_09865, partial [Woeseiales bacterium]